MRVEQKILRIVCAVLVSAAALMLASAFVDTDTAWYAALRKPELQPPPIVFGIVWLVLYALFAASLAWVCLRPKPPRKTLCLFLAVFVINALWTYSFFFRQNAVASIFVLLFAVTAALKLFLSVYRIDKRAAYLLIPYILWIGFALYLNYEIAFLN